MLDNIASIGFVVFSPIGLLFLTAIGLAIACLVGRQRILGIISLLFFILGPVVAYLIAYKLNPNADTILQSGLASDGDGLFLILGVASWAIGFIVALVGIIRIVVRSFRKK